MPDDLDNILSRLANEGESEDAKVQDDQEDVFKDTLDDIDRLPVSISALEDIIAYPSKTYPGEETVVISTRIPISLLREIEEMRDKIGSRLPKNVWPTNGDFFRWSAFEGVKKARAVQDQVDRGESKTPPILTTQLMLERTGGKLVAHANTRADAKEKAARTAELVQDLMVNGEYTVAANVITDWFDAARELRDQSAYWEATLIRALTHTPGIPSYIVQLIKGGHITDPEIIEQYEVLTKISRDQQEKSVDDLPISTDNLKDPEDDKSKDDNARKTKRPGTRS